MMHNLSIRARIALSIFGFSTVALLAMACSVYFAFERSLQSGLDGDLSSRTSSNTALVDVTSEPIELLPASDSGQERAKGEALIRLYDATGVLLDDGSPAAGIASREGDVVRRVAATSVEETQNLEYADGERFRVTVSPVYRSTAVVGVLVTGLETAQVDEPLRILRLVLLFAVPVTSVVLAAGSFFIAQRAMRPVVSITTSAQIITSGNLKERIQGVNTRDEIGELAETFNNMIDRIAETVDREQHFTADVAHELRTPLTAMEASVDVTLSQPRTPEEYERTLETIRDQTQRLNRLTRQLLLLSRLDADAFRSSFEELDLADLVRAVGASFAESHPEARVEVEADATLPFTGDPELLARAVTNLLENATQHGSPSVSIHISALVHDADLSIIVADDGSGVDSGQGDALFERFRRGNETRGRVGSGLGLAIVASIARAHGGSVRFQRVPAGAAVELRFPRTSPLG